MWRWYCDSFEKPETSQKISKLCHGDASVHTETLLDYLEQDVKNTIAENNDA